MSKFTTILDTLDIISDDLEDENFHPESYFLRQLREYVSENDNITTEDLLNWIAKYDWYQ